MIIKYLKVGHFQAVRLFLGEYHENLLVFNYVHMLFRWVFLR